MDRKVRITKPLSDLGKEYADRAVDFFKYNCHHVKGKWAGQPFIPTSWQEEDIRQIFGRVDEQGKRLIRQVYYEIPKKNGKSEMAAAVANKLLFADGEPGAEVYGAAVDKNQASLVFDVAASMVRKCPDLRKRSKIVDHVKRIVVPSTESFYRVVSADVGGKHGFNTHGVIFDEVHAQKNPRLWTVMTFGAGDAREQPLVFAITTAGIPGESPVAEVLHEDADQILRGVIPCPDSFYPVIYAAPLDAPWDSDEVLFECNPALQDGGFLNLDSIKKAREQAQRRVTEQNDYRRLRLNQWVASDTRWISLTDWDQGKLPFDIRDLKEMPCWIGVDLSTKLDLTSIVVCWMDGDGVFYLLPFFWIPRDNMEDRSEVERSKFQRWIEDGHLVATEGTSVDFEAVRSKLKELREEVGLDIQEVVFDPMFANQLAQQLDGDGFEMVEFRQTYRHFTEPCNALEAAVVDGRVRHGGHPVLRWNADCVTIRQNVDGGVRPVKPDRLQSRKRIDGVVASLMAISRPIVHQEVPMDDFLDTPVIVL